MKTLFMLIALFATKVVAADIIRFINAIAQVESGGDPWAVGKAGEVSAYQILPVNWHRYTDRPITEAHRPMLSQAVALRHLAWTIEELRKARPGMDDHHYTSPTLLAVAWRWGPRGTLPLTMEKIDYATRVVNLTLE